VYLRQTTTSVLCACGERFQSNTSPVVGLEYPSVLVESLVETECNSIPATTTDVYKGTERRVSGASVVDEKERKLCNESRNQREKVGA